MWLGLSVCLSCLSAHDLSEKAGLAPLAVSTLPQPPDPDGHSQLAGSVLCVEKQLASDPLSEAALSSCHHHQLLFQLPHVYHHKLCYGHQHCGQKCTTTAFSQAESVSVV